MVQGNATIAWERDYSPCMSERIVSAVQFACLGTGALLVSMVALARLDGELGRQSAIADFAQSAPAPAPDQSLWSPERIRDYQASLGLVTEVPQAILRIPDLGLEVPVYASDSELHLNRGAGLIAGMGLPGHGRQRRHRRPPRRLLPRAEGREAGPAHRDRDAPAPPRLPGRVHGSRGAERAACPFGQCAADR